METLKDIELPDPGFHDGIPFSDYLQWPAINSTMVTKFRAAPTPMHFRHWMKQPKDSKAMRIGRAVHASVFELDVFRDEYVLCDLNRNSNAWKDFEKEHTDRVIFKTSEMAKVLEMQDALRSHPRVKRILEQDGRPEVSGLWRDPEFDVERKIRLDWFVEGWDIVVDLKTARDASEYKFQKAIVDYGYDMKAAFYLDGLKALGHRCRSHVFIVIENEAPYAIAIYRLRDPDVEIGRNKVRTAMQGMMWCIQNDDWPGYETAVQDIELPEFAARQAAEEVA